MENLTLDTFQTVQQREADSYYSSAKGVLINRERVVKELRSHNMNDNDISSFFRECGEAELYDAQDVLNWLGY